MSNSRLNYEYFPRKIVIILKDITKSEREYRTLNNYIKIIGLVLFHQMSDEDSYYKYSSLSSAYWKKVIGIHYSKYVDRLVQEKVIQKDWIQYISDFGDVSRVMVYRINPDLMVENFVLIKYAGAKSESESAVVMDGKINGNVPINKIGIKSDLIQMQKREAREWINNNIPTVVSSFLNNKYIDGVPRTLPV